MTGLVRFFEFVETRIYEGIGLLEAGKETLDKLKTNSSDFNLLQPGFKRRKQMYQ